MHGCFFHGCKRHFRLPKTNKAFWRKKIERNIERHREATRALHRLGFRVIVVWEHDLRPRAGRGNNWPLGLAIGAGRGASDPASRRRPKQGA